MFHGLTNDFLYSAFKINSTFKNNYDNKKTTINGTAFFIYVQSIIYLVTNRHNLDAIYKDPKYRDYILEGIEITGRFSGDKLVTHKLRFKKEDILYSNTYKNDVACIANPIYDSLDGNSIEIDHYISESLIATASDFSNKLCVCDFVAYTGYPEWHDKIDTRPIFRTGTIASDPRQSYHYGDIDGESVAYEAFSYMGSSGSPIFALQKGLRPGDGIKFDGFRDLLLIGINGGHLPSQESSHSGMSYFYKSSVILDIIQRVSK